MDAEAITRTSTPPTSDRRRGRTLDNDSIALHFARGESLIADRITKRLTGVPSTPRSTPARS
jgi:hypothetical protein